MADESCKKDIILEAARKRFAHYGFAKVTMDEIAQDVGMGKASLYYYFPTKERVFQDVIAAEQDEFVKEIEHMIAMDIPASVKLYKYVERRLDNYKKLINLGTLSVHSFMDHKSVFKQLFKDFEKKELSLIQTIIDEGVKKGEFSKDLNKNTAEVLIHVLQGLRFRSISIITTSRMANENFENTGNEMLTAIELIINGMKC